MRLAKFGVAIFRLPHICAHADGRLARLRECGAPSAPSLGRGTLLFGSFSAGGAGGAWGAVISLGGFFVLGRVSGAVSIWSGDVGAIDFVWRGSVRFRRGDRGGLDPAGLTEASVRLLVMRMNGTPVLTGWYQGSAMSGMCRSASPLCLRHLPPQGGRVETAVRWAGKRARSPPLPSASPPSGGESGDGGAGAGKRARSPPLPAASPPSGGERGNGDYAQVSSGGSGEGGAVGGRRGASPLCLRHLPPQGGRVETAVRGLASAPGAPLCLRHPPPAPRGERGNGDYAQVSSVGESGEGGARWGGDAWLERAGPGEEHPDEHAGECGGHG